MARPNHQTPELETNSDDDEALRYAIALSLQEQGSFEKQSPDKDALANAPGATQQPKPQFGSLLLDRKAMEEERLKRLGKRRHSSSDDDDVVEIPPPKKQSKVSAEKGNLMSTTLNNTRGTNLPYPNGIVKRTWARGFPRTGDDIKIEEIFQKDDLELAVLSSFQWDDEWMISKLDMKKTKLLLLAFARDNAQKDEMRNNVPANIKFCFPPMNGPGSMHSKLQLLKYSGYLRIVVPTGNLVPYDWGETGEMENMVFLIDLPRLDHPAEHESTMFSRELEYFLRASGVNEKMVASLSNYDFSKTANVAFVHSIPGAHMGEKLRRVGYCGLGASVAALGLANPEPVEVDLACASLGSLSSELIAAIYDACQGNDSIAKASHKSTNKAAGLSHQVQDRFRIYFPTETTVTKSKGGRQAGGTICVQARWWWSPTFPRQLVRDSICTRDRLLMHSKLIFVRRTNIGKREDVSASPSSSPSSSTASQSPGWAYVGSANLSESAWGRLSKDKSTGDIKINCRNWECGVILPVAKPKLEEQTPVSADLGIFAGTIPVPMQVPGPKYAPSEKPWFYSGA